MDHFQSANHLLSHSSNSLKNIKDSYQKYLNAKEVSPILLIDIKNFMENLRSALDYTAHGLFDKYGDKSKLNAKIYFPYAWSGLSRADFIAKKIIEKNIPGISTNRPDIVKLLIDFQWFTSSNNEWLPIFMELNNQNKHQSLTPQIKKEYKQLNIQSGNVSISLGEGASIKLGQGASISFGGVNIKGGQEIDVNNPAKFSGNGTQEIVTWVSFNFQHNEVPVLPFLETSFIGASQIVKKLSVV